MDLPPARDLLAAAADIRAGVVAEDADALHDALTRLRYRLVEHARRCAPVLDALPGALPIVVRGGQQRLLAMVDDLLFAAEDTTGTCACVVRAAELDSRLRRQARLEATALPAARRRRRTGRRGKLDRGQIDRGQIDRGEVDHGHGGRGAPTG